MTNNNIAYVIYARKSSEAEERQMLSIESQIGEDKKIAQQRAIDITDGLVLSESKSAKSPYERPVFEQLIKDIEKGKVKGIVAWHPNRLSRNAIDAARLIDLFDKGLLVEIITSQQTFRNTPSDKFFFSMLCSQAKMENDNKSLDVKRGLRKKYEKGYPPNVSKVGYKNAGTEKGQKYLIADPDRFDLVKQLLQKYLKERMSVRDLLRYSDEVLGIKSIQRRKEGGTKLKLSQLYRILQDPFNAGFFYGKDENGEMVRYEVNESVPRMVTEQEYWKIQERLTGKHHTRPAEYKKDFVYKNYAACGDCGGPMTAHYKHQLICPECKLKFSYPNKEACPGCKAKIEKMENPTYLEYIYYVCARRCAKQQDSAIRVPSVQEKNINEDIAKYLENHLQISPDLRDWCLENLDDPQEGDRQDEFAVRASWERQLQEKRKELDELKLMRARRMIETDEELGRLQAPVKAEIGRIEEALAGQGGKGAPEGLERVKQGFSMAVGLAEIFRNGTFEEKNEALRESCSNLTIKGKNTTFQERKELTVVMNFLLGVKQENPNFEPKKFTISRGENKKKGALGPEFSTMLRR